MSGGAFGLFRGTILIRKGAIYGWPPIITLKNCNMKTIFSLVGGIRKMSYLKMFLMVLISLLFFLVSPHGGAKEAARLN
jgi:hypothetical protein